eukprot:717946-Pyramimonas_sp.AAC.1
MAPNHRTSLIWKGPRPWDQESNAAFARGLSLGVEDLVRERIAGNQHLQLQRGSMTLLDEHDGTPPQVLLELGKLAPPPPRVITAQATRIPADHLRARRAGREAPRSPARAKSTAARCPSLEIAAGTRRRSQPCQC